MKRLIIIGMISSSFSSLAGIMEFFGMTQPRSEVEVVHQCQMDLKVEYVQNDKSDFDKKIEYLIFQDKKKIFSHVSYHETLKKMSDLKKLGCHVIAHKCYLQTFEGEEKMYLVVNSPVSGEIQIAKKSTLRSIMNDAEKFMQQEFCEKDDSILNMTFKEGRVFQMNRLRFKINTTKNGQMETNQTSIAQGRHERGPNMGFEIIPARREDFVQDQ